MLYMLAVIHNESGGGGGGLGIRVKNVEKRLSKLHVPPVRKQITMYPSPQHLKTNSNIETVLKVFSLGNILEYYLEKYM